MVRLFAVPCFGLFINIGGFVNDLMKCHTKYNIAI